MRVYLVFPDVHSFHGIPYHPGLASIASVLLNNGHEVKIGYFKSLEEAGNILKEISEFKPQVVGFTAVETQFRYVKKIASQIKGIHPCIVICGGPYVTLGPEVILENDVFLDGIIAGEGEYALLQLVEKLKKNEDWLTTNNLIYKDSKTGQLARNPLNPFIQDLDCIPHPNTGLFPYQDIIDKHNAAMFHFNRGCPYRCSYCSNTALGEIYGRSYNPVRFRSVENVIEEINITISKYKLRDDTVLVFSDDLFIFDINWLREFCLLYKRQIGRQFWCTGRSNLVTDEVCALLKDAGCVIMMMSVESGNDYIRNKVMLRNISRELLFTSFQICRRHGLNTLATCIIGLPFETPEMIEDSIKTVAQLESITSYGINTFYPYKGTYLRKVCEERGYLPEETGDFEERKESVLNLPDLPKETILYYYENWIKLISRHKNKKERLVLFIRKYWDNIRGTPFGNKIRLIVNNTGFGKKIKKIIMKYIWKRTA
ncbi:MAG: B12-binding domain-containing radical SAM protein [Candidatus Omnitrophica bacterium]|nr:B12-binding domain-containing radical SAM protein [Candidatus Omnitrophota bacterium]